jgi:pyruvate/2-oxoglutarate dehydrogenase complex dihydrolipoamide dehydrogenase (E3) component
MKSTESASSAQVLEKTQPEQYDLVILGDGTGSTLAAWTFASDGKRVAVVERKLIGGSCPNIACLPSKNIIDSAKVATYFRGAERGGIAKPGSAIDMPAVLARKRRMVRGLNEMYLENFKSSGAELILGVGRFIGPGTLEVTLPDGARRQLRGANVIIDRNDRLLPREDDDVAEAVTSLFHDEGIEVLLNAMVTRISGKSGQSVKVILEQNGAGKTLEGSHLLVATGRTPNTQGIGLELAGVQVTDRGYIKVNERLQTTAPGVWAIGEVAGSPQFTHISIDDFRVVRDNLTGGNHITTGRQVPFCLFTDPEFARVGLSEKEAKAQGIAYRRLKIPMKSVLRAHALTETRGFLKAIVEIERDRILGFTAFAAGAGEVMSAVQIAMIAELPYTALRDAVLTHPTLVEGLIPLFSSAASARKVVETGRAQTSAS